MSHANSTFRAFADRPLAVHAAGLIAQPLQLGDAAAGGSRIRFHFSTSSWRMRNMPFAVARRPDGPGGDQAGFERLFAPLQLTLGQLRGVSRQPAPRGKTNPGRRARTGLQLLDRAPQAAARWCRPALNLLAIRFRGVDPDRILELRLSPPELANYRRTLFVLRADSRRPAARRTAIRCASDPAGGAHTFSLRQRRVAGGDAGPSRSCCTNSATPATCKHFGGRCHEMGSCCWRSCLYCDVSDTWLMPGKWRRVAVSSAGVRGSAAGGAVAHSCGGSLERDYSIHSA